MRKIILTIACLSNLAVFGQPIITDGTGILGIGNLYPAVFGSINDIGASGPSQTWDFSNVSFSSLGSLEVVDPSTSTFGPEFPTANWAFEVGTWTSYFEITGQEMNNLALNITGLGSAGDYSANPRKILEFPFSFGNSFNDTYSENGGSQNLIVTYDAYGTLIMPDNYTYTNVVRTSELEENGDILTRYYILEPFMNIATHFTSNDIFVWIKVTLPNSIEENKTNELTIFPNPVDNQLNIHQTFENSEDISICNLNGNVLLKVKPEFSTNGITSIDVSNLKSGCYFVKQGPSTIPFLKN